MALRGVFPPESVYEVREHQAAGCRPYDQVAEQSAGMATPAGVSANPVWHREHGTEVLCEIQNTIGEALHPLQKYRVRPVRQTELCSRARGACGCAMAALEGASLRPPRGGDFCRGFEAFDFEQEAVRGSLRHLIPVELGKYVIDRCIAEEAVNQKDTASEDDP